MSFSYFCFPKKTPSSSFCMYYSKSKFEFQGNWGASSWETFSPGSIHQTSLSHGGDIAHPTECKQVYWPIPLYIFESAFYSIQYITLNKTLSKIFPRFLALRKLYAYIWLKGHTGRISFFIPWSLINGNIFFFFSKYILSQTKNPEACSQLYRKNNRRIQFSKKRNGISTSLREGRWNNFYSFSQIFSQIFIYTKKMRSGKTPYLQWH